MQTTNQLVYAAGKGYLQDCVNFLKNGAKINATDEQGNTALHMAAGAGHAPVVELLLKQKGVDLGATNALGDTPLHKAVWRDNAEVVKMLVGAGAKEVKNKHGKTPSDLARSKEVEKLLHKDTIEEKDDD